LHILQVYEPLKRIVGRAKSLFGGFISKTTLSRSPGDAERPIKPTIYCPSRQQFDKQIAIISGHCNWGDSPAAEECCFAFFALLSAEIYVGDKAPTTTGLEPLPGLSGFLVPWFSGESEARNYFAQGWHLIAGHSDGSALSVKLQ